MCTDIQVCTQTFRVHILLLLCSGGITVEHKPSSPVHDPSRMQKAEHEGSRQLKLFSLLGIKRIHAPSRGRLVRPSHLFALLEVLRAAPTGPHSQTNHRKVPLNVVTQFEVEQGRLRDNATLVRAVGKNNDHTFQLTS